MTSAPYISKYNASIADCILNPLYLRGLGFNPLQIPSKNYVKVGVCLWQKKNVFRVSYSQSPLPRISACHPCRLCVPRWGTCPGTRCPCGDGSYHYAAGAPPACPCRPLRVWGGVPGGGGCPGRPAELHASWVFPSNTSRLPAHHAPLWPPQSPPSHASKAEKAASIHHLKRTNILFIEDTLHGFARKLSKVAITNFWTNIWALSIFVTKICSIIRYLNPYIYLIGPHGQTPVDWHLHQHYVCPLECTSSH